MYQLNLWQVLDAVFDLRRRVRVWPCGIVSVVHRGVGRSDALVSHDIGCL